MSRVRLRRLRQEPGQDLLLAGSAHLFNALVRADLINVYRLMVHPIVLGGGARLFAADTEQKALTLTHTKTFSTGIVLLEYQPTA